MDQKGKYYRGILNQKRGLTSWNKQIHHAPCQWREGSHRTHWFETATLPFGVFTRAIAAINLDSSRDSDRTLTFCSMVIREIIAPFEMLRFVMVLSTELQAWVLGMGRNMRGSSGCYSRDGHYGRASMNTLLLERECLDAAWLWRIEEPFRWCIPFCMDVGCRSDSRELVETGHNRPWLIPEYL